MSQQLSAAKLTNPPAPVPDVFSDAVAGSVPPPGTPDGSFLRDDGTWDLPAIQAGVPTMSYAGLTTTSSSSGSVWSDITGSGVSVEAGRAYHIRYRLRTYSAANTTGLALRRALDTATGTVLGFHALGMSNATATISRASREGTVDEFVATGNATSSTSASGSYWVDVLFSCTGAGTFKLQMRSEVDTSSVTVDGDGSYVVVASWEEP